MTIILTEPVIWLLIILTSIFSEAIFEKNLHIWCAPSAAAALTLGMLGMSVRTQGLIFALAASVLILSARILPAIMRRIRSTGAHKLPSADIHSNK